MRRSGRSAQGTRTYIHIHIWLKRYLYIKCQAVAHLVEALCYKPVGHRFDSLRNYFFLIYLTLQAALGLRSIYFLAERTTRNLPECTEPPALG
jgi:hypothetical protein